MTLSLKVVLFFFPLYLEVFGVINMSLIGFGVIHLDLVLPVDPLVIDSRSFSL